MPCPAKTILICNHKLEIAACSPKSKPSWRLQNVCKQVRITRVMQASWVILLVLRFVSIMWCVCTQNSLNLATRNLICSDEYTVPEPLHWPIL